MHLSQNSIDYLMNNAGCIIKYRVEKEILKKDNYEQYRKLILNDPRVLELLSWQQEDGYFGNAFHGGWLPVNVKIKSSKAMEVALRFLAETGLKISEPFIFKALASLNREDYNRSYSSWDIFCPNKGLYGSDYERDGLLALFNKANDNIQNSSIAIALERMKYLAVVKDIKEFSDLKKGQYFVQESKALPDLYQLRLLAYTNSWRSSENINIVTKAIKSLILISPLPTIYIKHKSQRITPATITKLDFSKDLTAYTDFEWYQFISIMILFSKLGVVTKINRLNVLFNQLTNKVLNNNGILDLPVKHKVFKVWGAYSGLMLEENWKGKRKKCDLTFRYLSIAHEVNN